MRRFTLNNGCVVDMQSVAHGWWYELRCYGLVVFSCVT